MDKAWTCEGIEVTICGIEVMIDGSIERFELDEDLHVEEVTITAIYPVVLVKGVEEYNEFPLSVYPIEWRDELVTAIHDEAFNQYEKSQEDR